MVLAGRPTACASAAAKRPNVRRSSNEDCDRKHEIYLREMRCRPSAKPCPDTSDRIPGPAAGNRRRWSPDGVGVCFAVVNYVWSV